MILADGAFGLILLGLWLFCIIDVITTDEAQVRNLPKVGWLLIVVLLFDIGSLAWLIAGRNWQGTGQPRVAQGAARRFPQYDRPGRAVPTNPDDDEAFLRDVQSRADAQRRQYQERRKRELEAERSRLTDKPDEDRP